MRPVKQAAVVSTHTLVFFAPLATSSTVVGLIMLTRFSRDAFLFVSASMLAYSYKDTKAMNLRQYFKRRFTSVGVPYLAWTVIYYFFTLSNPVSGFPFYTLHGSGAFSVSGFHYFIHILWTGYYHLYYLIVIMEFYALFPLLLLLVRRFPQWHARIFVMSILWQIVYGVFLNAHYFGFTVSGYTQTRLILSYPIYLVGGVIAAMHLDDVHQWVCRHTRSILVGTVMAALVAEIFAYLERFSWLPAYLHTGPDVFAPALVPYNVGAILCVYLLGVYLVSPKRTLRTRAMVQSGSDNSYGVYLSQMLWIPFLLRIDHNLSFHIPWPIVVPLVLVIVYFVGFGFTAFMARTPLARAVTGRSRAPWSTLIPHTPRSEAVLHPDTGDSPLDVAKE